jgi:hypothetical protein
MLKLPVAVTAGALYGHMFGGKRRNLEKIDFVIIGAQKSGSTALHYFLSRHRRICMGDQQEMHFFDDDKAFAGNSVNYAALHDHYPKLGPGVRAGDCTPSYLYHQAAAERIHRYHHGIRLIVLLRNPVERAFAHWNMQRFKGREPLDFLPAVKEEKTRLKNAPAADARRFAYVDRGYYAQQLSRFLKLFPREQVKAVKFENFNADQSGVVNDILAFLGLDALRSVRNRDRNVVPYPRMLNWEERVYLYHFFADEIVKLEQLLGWDCSDWKL